MPRYTFKEFKSDQEVRWCPGCGDHGVLAALQRALPDVTEALGYSKERYVVVSGIGCSSRLPYYMNTYGFHSIHGRATAISTGIKVANPDLTVWQACGDGDALAIGGNHFIHAIRRNVDINIILFNNQIYGLTKGQYSPTSRFGAISKTSPYGTVEHPFNPGSLVLGAKGTFFARSLDSELKLTSEIMLSAAKHDGCSVMEVLTNCVIFNDGAHKLIADREVRADRTIVLRHGEKMIFGKEGNKGIAMDGTYGFGANLHRSAWGGRNYEYFSEDGFLAGEMGGIEVKGIRKMGVDVVMKHFALNDCEQDRLGQAAWLTEQAARFFGV